jgi:hypothetical protein
MAYIVTCGADNQEFDEWKDDVSPFAQAVNLCWNLCYEELERAYGEEEITSREFRKELRCLNSWYKEIKAQPSKAEIFYVFNKPFVYLKEV